VFNLGEQLGKKAQFGRIKCNGFANIFIFSMDFPGSSTNLAAAVVRRCEQLDETVRAFTSLTASVSVLHDVVSLLHWSQQLPKSPSAQIALL
jgi:hypothetical protein